MTYHIFVSIAFAASIVVLQNQYFSQWFLKLTADDQLNNLHQQTRANCIFLKLDFITSISKLTFSEFSFKNASLLIDTCQSANP